MYTQAGTLLYSYKPGTGEATWLPAHGPRADGPKKLLTGNAYAVDFPGIQSN